MSIDYPLSRYPHRYKADTDIIFGQRNGNRYYTIHIYGYLLTSLMIRLTYSINKYYINKEYDNFYHISSPLSNK
jgi:hypothetical protein